MEENKKSNKGVDFINALIKCMQLHKKHTDLVSQFLNQKDTLDKADVETLRKLMTTVSLSQGLVVKALESVAKEYYKYN